MLRRRCGRQAVRTKPSSEAFNTVDEELCVYIARMGVLVMNMVRESRVSARVRVCVRACGCLRVCALTCSDEARAKGSPSVFALRR